LSKGRHISWVTNVYLSFFFFFFFFFFTLVTDPKRSLVLNLSDARVYEPQTKNDESFSSALMCATRRWIPASSSANQRFRANEKQG
jgi:hypothetical protein